MDDQVVVSVLVRDDAFEILFHVCQFGGKSFQTIDFVDNDFGKLTLRSVFDVSEQMFYTNFFSLCGTDSCWNMNKLSFDVSVYISFFLCKVSFSRKTYGVLFLNSDNNKHWLSVISSKNLIDVNIILANVRTSRIPTYDLFS